jgi:hypothetical protein
MMNEQQPASVSGMDSAIVSRYEGLRRHVLGLADETDRGSGLALFVRQGMTSWMQAWSQCGIPGAAISQIKNGPEKVSSMQLNREAVMILASMALSGRCQEARQ